jgi:hypothetical protein
MKLCAVLALFAFTAGPILNHSSSQPSMGLRQAIRDNDQDPNTNNGKAPDPEFGDAEASELMNLIRDGLEGHNAAKMLSAFDDSKMEGYQGFRAQVAAMFDQFEAFRIHFHITEVRAEGVKGTFSVDLEIEETPRSSGALAVRKRESVRFGVEQGSKGWKIVDLQPRSFFS